MILSLKIKPRFRNLESQSQDVMSGLASLASVTQCNLLFSISFMSLWWKLSLFLQSLLHIIRQIYSSRRRKRKPRDLISSISIKPTNASHFFLLSGQVSNLSSDISRCSKTMIKQSLYCVCAGLIMVLQLLVCVMHGVNHGGGCIRNRCEGLVTNAGRRPPSSSPTVRAVHR